ncbi:MAG TPA: hypothetical protein DGG95_04905 [Cytophagales bacterium]|jgi:hypothetical protein|nr:hypothetical protein [Cytophagales bacterium]
MKVKLFLFFFLVVNLFQCDYKDIQPKCYHGTVIMSSCCTGSTFISLDSSIPIGKQMKWGEKEYANVIQVPNYLNVTGDIYLTLRPFDRDKDQSLFPPIQCYCFVVVGMDVPIYVATSYSSQPCNNSTYF